MEEKKYNWQICQDEEINNKFHKLHSAIVDMVISFCKDNNLDIDQVELGIDGIKSSIPYGSWQPCTDSWMNMYERTRSVRDIELEIPDPYLCVM
jgi:hypothetical protein